MINKKNYNWQIFINIYICTLFFLTCFFFHYNSYLYKILTLTIFIKVGLISIYFLKKKIENKEFINIYYLSTLFIIYFFNIITNKDLINISDVIKPTLYLFSLLSFYLLSLNFQEKFFRLIFVGIRFLIFFLTLLLILFVIYETDFQSDYNKTIFFIKEFYYRVIFHTGFFNLFLFFIILLFFKFNKVLFKSKINTFFFIIILFHSFFSVSLAINIIALGLIAYLLLIYCKVKKIYINWISISLALITICLIFIFTETLINYFNNSGKKFYIKDLINAGEIESITIRLSRIIDFKNYLQKTGIKDVFFGTFKIQHESFYHNSFFRIQSYFGFLILLFVLFTVFLKTKENLIIPLICIFYFFTTDHLLIDNYLISFLFWTTYTLVNIDQNKITAEFTK